GQLEGGPRRHALGDGGHSISDKPPLLPGSVGGRRFGGLDPNDLDLGINGLGRDTGARRAAAAADRHDDDLYIRLLFHDFQRLGRDAGDQVRLVPRVDVSVAVLRGQPLTMFASLIEVLAVANDLRAKPADRFDLDRVRAFGYADDRPNSEESRGIGDRLSVVSGGGSDDTAASLVVGQLRHQIDPAADLEGADRLVVLVFDPGLRANQLVERWISI